MLHQLTADQIDLFTQRERHEYIRRNFHADKNSLAKRRPVHGVGINDATCLISVVVYGKRMTCPAYISWVNMLERCYSPTRLNKHPSYRDVTVCDDWLLFSGFMSWWATHQVDGWQLDKDLLSDGKCYSPETCIFVPSWLNSFLIDCGTARGACPLGVNIHKPGLRYRATIRNPSDGRKEHLGLFDDALAAHNAWKRRKLELASLLKFKIDNVDSRIYDRVIYLIGRK